MDQSLRIGSLADPVLLEAIDKLFELNIGNYIDLPQVRSCPIFNRKMNANTLSRLLW